MGPTPRSMVHPCPIPAPRISRHRGITATAMGDGCWCWKLDRHETGSQLSGVFAISRALFGLLYVRTCFWHSGRMIFQLRRSLLLTVVVSLFATFAVGAFAA